MASIGVNPHISLVSATASQVLPWLRYVSACDPQSVKNTPAVANLTCLATKGLNLIPSGLRGLATKRVKYTGLWKNEPAIIDGLAPEDNGGPGESTLAVKSPHSFSSLLDQGSQFAITIVE